MSQTPIDIESTNYDSSTPDQSAMDDETVILNIGGIKFEVLPSTLCKYPNTLLGQYFSPSNKHMRKPDKKGEYFFDRNGRVFEVILNFYRTGKLVIPTEIPQELLREELKYFKLEYNDESDSSKESEDEKILKLPKDQIYSFSNNLIHSTSKFEVKRGLYFLLKLREIDNNSYLYKYSIAFAYYRLGMNKEGLEVLEEILATDPHNPQCRSLMVLFNDSRSKNATIGLIALGLIIVGVFGIYKLKSWYSARQLLSSAAAATAASATLASSTSPSSIAPSFQSAVVNAVSSPSSSSSISSSLSSIPQAAQQIVKQVVTDSVVDNALNTTTTTIIKSTTADTTSSFVDAMNQSMPQFRK